ncbi:MAG TPA: hypothetical protein VK457_08335 [Chloroflexota bacterium]|nr:hypothetical protein [Chloroflexota bacterium]
MSGAAEFVLSPGLTLSLFLAVIYTVAVHLFMGLGFRRLLWHWLLAIAGMAAGAALAVRANSHLPTLGDAHLIESSLAALAILLLAAWRDRLTAETPAR